MFVKSLVAAAFAGVVAAQEDLQFTAQGKFSLKNAAFLSVEHFEGSEDFLLVSSFGALSSGHIYMVPGVADGVKNGDVSNL